MHVDKIVHSGPWRSVLTLVISSLLGRVKGREIESRHGIGQKLLNTGKKFNT
jgi:hypothetical protein